MVKVSIVIPVFRVADYIEQCVQSVMAQTYNDIECIIVDDYTDDDSINRCNRLIEDYRGPISFHVHHHSENRGLSAARNTGIEVSSGTYLYFLDGDDVITPFCIEKMVSLAEKYPGVELVHGEACRYPLHHNDSFKRKSLFCCAKTNDEVRNSFYSHQLLWNAWNKLLLRDFITRNQLYFREGVLYEDVLWMFFVVKYLSCVCFCNTVTYYQNVRPESIMMGTDQQTSAVHYLIVLTDILTHLTPGSEREEMSYYADDVCKQYVRHRNNVLEYDGLIKKFWRYSRQYHCLCCQLKAIAAYIVAHIPCCIPLFLYKGIRFLRK